MSNTSLIIEERSRDIGDFLVGRLLPFRKKRMVGPFIFIDHMGPTTLKPGQWMDVDQHPHIGLSTLTFLLEGALQHQDSLGTNVRIAPGSVNWMTAGRGVTHTERTPQDIRETGEPLDMHGYQIWVALPKEKEQMEPEFHHLDAAELPQWEERGAQYTLVAGSAFAKASPLPVHSPLFMVEIVATQDHTLDASEGLEGEIGVCVVTGSVVACDQTVEAGHLLVSKTEDACKITVTKGSHIFLFGGPAFPEERFIHWNFVSSKKEIIEQAKADWKAKKFPKVPDDSTYVPLPERR
ncbi:pirin family protein [Croceiramulus getboli]|nr:pirin family protein [Flavobacteriaceae bacterium YJPT1-3]